MTIAARQPGNEADNADLLPGDVFRLPLLDAAAEKQADLRKWAAVQACLRLLVSDQDSRQLLERFARACLETPPDPLTFVPRDRYSQLRTELSNLLPDKPGSEHLRVLLQQLDNGTEPASLMRTLRAAELPATLVVGLACIELRSLGGTHRDATADILLLWAPTLIERSRTASHVRAEDIEHAIGCYLAARDTLVLHNMRLVYKLARRNLQHNLPMRDLVQEGSRGLMRAAEKFNYRLGYRFTTYAFNWINQHIQRACFGDDSLLTYPAHVHQQINQIHKLRMEHIDRTGEEPSLESIASGSKLSLAKVRELRQLSNITVSLDQPISEHSELAWGDTLPDTSDGGWRTLEHGTLARLLGARLGRLDEMEDKVLRRRYGLGGAIPMTLKQVSAQLGISAEWARQLEKNALGKLRDDAELAHAFELHEAD